MEDDHTILDSDNVLEEEDDESNTLLENRSSILPRPENRTPTRFLLFVITLTLCLFAAWQYCTFPSPTAHLPKPAHHTQIKSIFNKSEGVETWPIWQLGDNNDLESINVTTRPTVVIGSSSNNNSIALDINVTTFRSSCITGNCLYRAYISGPQLFGTYLKKVSNSYVTSANLLYPGLYHILIFLEAKSNASSSSEFIRSNSLGWNSKTKMLTVAERISKVGSVVKIPKNLFNRTKNNLTAACSYRPEAYDTQGFTWIRRSLMKNNGFKIPSSRLDPTKSNVHFTKHFLQHREWIQDSQSHVYVATNCIQKWIDPQKDFIDKIPPSVSSNLVAVVIGTSRLREVQRALKVQLLRNTTGHNIQIEYFYNSVRSSRPSVMTDRLTEFFSNSSLVTSACKKNANKSVVFIISHGIWEAKYFFHTDRNHAKHHKFNFTANAHNTINFIQKNCPGSKIIVATNPMVHPVDAKYKNEKKLVLKLSSNTPLVGPLIETLNRQWVEAARYYNLSIVDLQSASWARRDKVYDNLHYRIVNTTDNQALPVPVEYSWAHRRKFPRFGNDVSTTFTQMIIAAMAELLINQK